MENIFTKLFKKERIPANGFGTTLEQINNEERKQNHISKKKDIIVKTDVAFHKPTSKVIDEIKSKFKEADYTNLEFEEEIEDFNLKVLSSEAKRLIIEIIKEDMKFRATKLEEIAENDKTRSEKMIKDIEENGWKAEYSTLNLKKTDQMVNISIYGINPNTGEVGIIDEFTKDKLVTFDEYTKSENIMNAKELLKHKEESLYKFVANTFPEKSHDQIIEFIKENIGK